MRLLLAGDWSDLVKSQPLYFGTTFLLPIAEERIFN
ncbi:hypothetical protein ABIC37_002010 [Priestia megaterium]